MQASLHRGCLPAVLVIWLKVLHIATLLFWAGTLFYLPGLFAAHVRHRPGGDAFLRLRRKTRFTYVAVASPAAVLAVASGTGLIFAAGETGDWLAMKLTAVSGMVLFHVYCGRLLGLLRDAPRRRPAAFHHGLVAVPAVLVPLVLWLVLAKPVVV